MLKVGLTGGIGSGKSTVSKMLRGKGICIIDADQIAREVVERYREISIKIKAEFGEIFFDAAGKLKRRELGSFIFQDEERRKALERIIMPFIEKEIFLQLQQHKNRGEKICVVDAPTLIEQNMHKKMDVTIVVWVDEKTQRERVAKRDGLETKEIQNRIKAQFSLEEKRNIADYVIHNERSLEETKRQLENILTELYRLEGEK